LPELERVLRAARRHARELAIISFNFEALRQSKRMFPDLEHYYLHSYKKDPVTQAFPEISPLLQRAREAGFDGLDLHYDWPITKSFVAQVKAAGLKLIVWTVDEEAIAKGLVNAGVDGITTNRPKWLRERLSNAP
jgi:glycerophosphoryl diester phosphodiesterase